MKFRFPKIVIYTSGTLAISKERNGRYEVELYSDRTGTLGAVILSGINHLIRAKATTKEKLIQMIEEMVEDEAEDADDE